METLLSISIALICGLLITRLTKHVGLPAVTGYLIAGVLIGPYCLGRLGITSLFSTAEGVGTLGIISDVALGFIAFSIGTEFRLDALKKIGKQATVIGIVQAIIAMVFVDAALIGLHFILGDEVLPLTVAITLGAIATATAPAATLMVVKQYKAKGPLTDILLPVVALDDAVGLVCFAVSFGIAKAIQSGEVDMISIIVNPLIEIVGSLVLGAVMGIVFNLIEKLFESNSKRLCISITFVFLTVALSMLKFRIGAVTVGFSSLLTCMMLGTVFCNVCENSIELMDRTDKWNMPILVLFFVISGATLEFDVFASPAIIGVGVVYIIMRSAGKYIGSALSAKATHCSEKIVKYLGITLLPQAGVSIGMAVTAAAVLGADGELVRNIVLFAVLIYELVGPMLTKIALTKAGDIVPKADRGDGAGAEENV